MIDLIIPLKYFLLFFLWFILIGSSCLYQSNEGMFLHTFHLFFYSNFSVLSTPPFPLQVDVSSPGAPRVAFKPDCRQLATSVSLLSEPVNRLQLDKTEGQSFRRPAAWVGLPSPWTRSPPTLDIPTTPGAQGDPTGMGKTK